MNNIYDLDGWKLVGEMPVFKGYEGEYDWKHGENALIDPSVFDPMTDHPDAQMGMDGCMFTVGQVFEEE